MEKNRFLVHFSLIYLNVELELEYNSYAGGNCHYCYYYCYLLYLIWARNNELFKVTHSTTSGYYRYSVSGGPELAGDTVVFLDFYLLVSVCLPMFHSICVSIHRRIGVQFVWGFKNLLLRSSPSESSNCCIKIFWDSSKN